MPGWRGAEGGGPGDALGARLRRARRAAPRGPRGGGARGRQLEDGVNLCLITQND